MKIRTGRLLLLFLVLGSGARFLASQSEPSIPPQPGKTVLAQAQQNIASRLRTSASSLFFGNEQLNSPSAPQLLTITNPRRSAVVFSEVASSATDFRLVHNCALAPDVMPAGGSCSISVQFVPGSVGPRSGTIKIAIVGDLPPLIISLAGNGTDSPLKLSQTYLSFRTLLVGMTSMPQVVRLTNRSDTAPAAITSISVSPDFALVATNAQCVAGNTLAPLASCNLSVLWTPTDSGTRSGQVRIADSDAAFPHIIDLQATATGIWLSTATLKWTTTAVGAMGNSQSMEVRNEGRTPIEIESIEASGDFFQQNNCGKELPQHQNCVVTVWFQPTDAGKRVGTVLIHDSDPTRMQQTLLTGIGSTLDLSPVEMDFGAHALQDTSASQFVTVSNRGVAKVNIAAVNVSGDFVIPGKTCGDTVAPGQSCRISISFSPTAAGVRTGVLNIETGNGSVRQNVTLSGTGLSGVER